MGIQHTKMNLEQQFNWRKNGPILTLASQDNAFKLPLSQVRLSQLQYEKKYTIYLIIIIMAILLPLQLLSTAHPPSIATRMECTKRDQGGTDLYVPFDECRHLFV